MREYLQLVRQDALLLLARKRFNVRVEPNRAKQLLKELGTLEKALSCIKSEAARDYYDKQADIHRPKLHAAGPYENIESKETRVEPQLTGGRFSVLVRRLGEWLRAMISRFHS